VTDDETSVRALKSRVAEFCTARDWDRYHRPKELAVGVITEAAELLDRFRFKADEEVAAILADPKGRVEVEHELADVLFFVLRFAERTGIDLATAIERKMMVNAERYPVEKARGSNRKYSEL
jgi:NTP pyrophosphatase (non-canonical NTP hydrolase)